jgi:hypothetical protein
MDTDNRRDVTMGMDDVQFARLAPEHLQKIRDLEAELAAATQQPIMLLAYEQRDDGRAAFPPRM